MKKILTLLALAAAVPALAQNTVPVSDVELNHEGDNMVVSMNVDLSALKPVPVAVACLHLLPRELVL